MFWTLDRDTSRAEYVRLAIKMLLRSSQAYNDVPTLACISRFNVDEWTAQNPTPRRGLAIELKIALTRTT